MKLRLVYGVYLFRNDDEDGMIVFLEQAEAEQRAAEWATIKKAKTWGQFRKLILKERYDEILSYFDTIDEPRPKGKEPLDDSAPWLGDEEWSPLEDMVDFLPSAVLSLGERADTPGMGDWVSFGPNQESTVGAALKKAGYAVERDDELVRRACGHWIEDNFA